MIIIGDRSIMNKKNKIQFTKIIIMMVLIWAMLMVSATYVLQAFHREPPETLSVRIVELVIAAIITYCLKAFFETKEAEKTRLKEKEMEHDNTNCELDERPRG